MNVNAIYTSEEEPTLRREQLGDCPENGHFG